MKLSQSCCSARDLLYIIRISRVTNSTNTDFSRDLQYKIRVFINCACVPGFSIDYCTLFKRRRMIIYYTVSTRESVAVLSRVPQARVTIRLQMSDVSQYTLYNTFIMFPDPAAIGTHRYRDLGNGRGLATVAPRNQRTIQVLGAY